MASVREIGVSEFEPDGEIGHHGAGHDPGSGAHGDLNEK
jgi:hypothetical protein